MFIPGITNPRRIPSYDPIIYLPPMNPSDSDLAALHFATLAVAEMPLLANGNVSASTVAVVNGVRYVVAVSREAPGALGLSSDPVSTPSPSAESATI